MVVINVNDINFSRFIKYTSTTCKYNVTYEKKARNTGRVNIVAPIALKHKIDSKRKCR